MDGGREPSGFRAQTSIFPLLLFNLGVALEFGRFRTSFVFLRARVLEIALEQLCSSKLTTHLLAVVRFSKPTFVNCVVTACLQSGGVAKW